MTITQQSFNTDEVYVSIYDKPKRGIGRPKLSLTDEERAKRTEKTIEINRNYYKDNREYCLTLLEQESSWLRL